MTMQSDSEMDRDRTMGTGMGMDVPIGAHVFTSDGDDLGVVKEFTGDYFKVDAAMQRDYWLSHTHVASSMGNRVVMSFDKDRLGDFKLDEPSEGRKRRAA